LKSKKNVAIKCIKLSEDVELEKIEEETKHLKECDHNNIMKVYSSFYENGMYYIVMELIEGKKLTDLLGKKELNEQRISEITKGILEALNHLHKINKIHRDIKSDNIMVNPNLTLD
jgi:serine/threonine protein kinase